MYEHKWLPYHMTHGHWMANNIFIYYPMLLLGSIHLYIQQKKYDLFWCGYIDMGTYQFWRPFLLHNQG